MANKNPNMDGLKPVRNKIEASKRGHIGGIKSGEARREKATMKSILEKMLKEKNEETGKTYGELATLGLIKGATKGNGNNYRIMMVVLGELAQAEENQRKQELSKVEELLTKIEGEASK